MKTILQIAFLFNHNELDFDTRFTDDEWIVVHQDSLMNTVILDNPVVGQFVFKRIQDTQEYSLTDMLTRTVAAKTWHNMLVFIDDVIENPMLLDKFKK